MTRVRLRCVPGFRQSEPVRLPGSKSVAARALVCRYVSGGDVLLSGLPSCDDTRELAAALDRLASIAPAERSAILPHEFHLGNGATSLRFFLAVAASVEGLDCVVDCSDGLRRRPLAPLIDALRRLGADIFSLEREGYAPLRVRGRKIDGGGRLRVDGSVSSQFLSALMLASPLWERPVDFVLPAEMVSALYVEMTRRVMADFAAASKSYTVEPDWSAAGFFYELAMARPGMPITIEALARPERSLQGDAAACAIFDFLGAATRWHGEEGNAGCAIYADPKILTGLKACGYEVRLSMREVPDMVPALAAALCMAGIPFELTGVGHLRHKESDRLAALEQELAKAGFALSSEPGDDALRWSGRRLPADENPVFESWGDHRMAMAMAMMAPRLGQVTIEGGEVVTKSFPGFYEEIEKVGIIRL